MADDEMVKAFEVWARLHNWRDEALAERPMNGALQALQDIYAAGWKAAVAHSSAGEGHSWHSYGDLAGENVSWCSRCDLLAFTGREPDGPCIAGAAAELGKSAHPPKGA